MRLVLIAVALVGMTTAAEQKQVQWLEARVVAQERVEGGARAGGSGMSIGAGASADVMVVPIIDNYVTIETADARLKMVEARPGRFSRRQPLVAPVNGTVKYTRSGNQFTLLDAEGKEHKFTLVSEVQLTAAPTPTETTPRLSRIEDRLLEPEFGYQQFRSGVPSWQAMKEVTDAMVALRTAHPDLDQMMGLMRIIMESLRPNWTGLRVDEYLESLYVVSKYAGFSVAAREALAQRDRAGAQQK